jgi:hypothetical protein
MASRVRLLVAASVVAGTFVMPAASPAGASTRCDPLRYHSARNFLRQNASNGARLAEYHVTVSWCTAANNSMQPRVYSPRRSGGSSITTTGLLAGWSFDRVLGEQRTYFTYKHVPLGGYRVITRVNFVHCAAKILPVCTNQPGWLHTYVHYDGTAIAVRGWN